MNKVLGIVFSNMHEHTISELTAQRCMGSIPVGGRYRVIDFPLSNLANSGVEQVGIVTKSNYQSLMDHLGSGRAWDLTRKNRGLVILPPFGRSDMGMYRSRVEALSSIMGYIKGSGAKNVITADCDMLASIDYTDFVSAHRESGADITVMYKRMPVSEEAGREQCILHISEDGYVRELLINSKDTGVQDIYMNIMVTNREFLEDAIDACYSRGKFSFESDVLGSVIERGRVLAYEFTGYVSRLTSMRSYFATNMALLDSSVRRSLFPDSNPIYTKVRDEAPVRYGLENRVSNTLIADGCLIEGEVENSVLFRGVHIAKGAKVKNSILMQGTKVGAGSNLDYVVSDKDVTIRDGRMIMGFETYPVYIAKRSAV